MDTLAKLAENILATVNIVGVIVSTVLEVNYHLAATLVHLLSQTTSALSSLAFLSFEFLVSALEDFQFFLTEVFNCFYYLVKWGVQFANEACRWVVNGVSGVAFALGTIHQELGSAVGMLSTLLGAVVRTIFYVAGVFVDALLVLLQCVPYVLVLLVQCIVSELQLVVYAARDFAWRTRNSAVRSVLAMVDAIHRIPVDAYVGLATVVVVGVLYRKTPLGYYMSPAKLARMARRMFRLATRTTTRVLLHRIPNTGRSLARCMMGCLSYFSEVVRSWFSRDGGGQEDEDVDWEDAQPHAASLPGEIPTTSDSIAGGDKLTLEETEKLRKELERQKERSLCVICQDQPKSVILLPCRHLCLCEECCTELLDRRSTCPLCRTPILNPIQVFV